MKFISIALTLSLLFILIATCINIEVSKNLNNKFYIHGLDICKKSETESLPLDIIVMIIFTLLCTIFYLPFLPDSQKTVHSNIIFPMDKPPR